MTEKKTKKQHTPEEILNFLTSNDILSLDNVAADMEKAERDKILAEHPYSITEGKDGRFRTYVMVSKGKRKLIARNSRSKVEDALIDFYTCEEEDVEDPRGVSLSDIFDSWIEYKRLHGCAPAYIRRINCDWHNYYEGDPIVKKPIVEIKKLEADIWIHKLIERLNHQKKAFYNVSMIIRQMLDYAVDMEIVNTNVVRKVNVESRMVFTPQSKKSSDTQVFTVDEVNRLYQAAWDDFSTGHNQIHRLAPLAVMFQFQTGVRLGELCALKYEDIEGDEIYVHRMYRYETHEVVDFTKGRNPGRYVILTSEAKRLIDTAKGYQEEHGLPAEGYIFSVNDDPVSYNSIRRLYVRYCEIIDTSRKSSHKARKTYISALIDGGLNIDSIRKLAGHADERTTYNCYCFDRRTHTEQAEIIERALDISV